MKPVKLQGFHQVWGQVYRQVDDQVRNQVWDQVWDQVWRQVDFPQVRTTNKSLVISLKNNIGEDVKDLL